MEENDAAKGVIPKNPHNCYESVGSKRDDDQDVHENLRYSMSLAPMYREEFRVKGLCPYWSVEIRPFGAHTPEIPMGRCMYLNSTDIDLFGKSDPGALYQLVKCCDVNR